MVDLDHFGEQEARHWSHVQRSLHRHAGLEPAAVQQAPDTGKRQAWPSSPEAWVTEDVQDLRNIDDALWQQFTERQGAVRQEILIECATHFIEPKAERGRRARYLLSGVLNSGCCGSSYITISADRYGSAADSNSSTCRNRKTVARKDVETRVPGDLKTGWYIPT
jgi:site-specific DNA recombinase